MHRSKRLRTARRTVAGTLATLAFCVSVHAQPRSFEIPPGDMRSALEAYATQSGVQLVYKIEDVRGLSTRGVKRSATPEEALQNLLEGTPIKVRRDADGAVVLFLAPTASAAPAPQQQQLESVIISANRRREPAREVPMQVGVLQAEQLERSGARSLGDYLTREAGVDIRSEGGAGFGAISVRGVSTGTQTIPTVGVYVDDVAVGSSSAFARGSLLFLDMGLLDLNHIELLRGPQGTLYGAGAMGGLLKYVTNVPDTVELSGKVSLGGTTTREGRAGALASGVVNLPLKEDVAAVRLSAYRERAGGWVDATGPAAGPDINRGDSTGARASFLATPNRDLTLRVTATLQDIKRDGYDLVEYDPVTSRPTAGELERPLWVREPYRVKTTLFSGEVEYDFGWARLDAITSHQKVDHIATVDVSAIYVPFLAQAAGLNLGTASITTPVWFERTAQEFRLTSKSDSKFEWLAGLYFDHEKGSNQQFADSTLPDGSPGPNLATIDIPSRYKEYAAFGDLTWKFTPALSVTGGLRVAHNSQTFRQDSSGLLAGGMQSLNAESSDTSTTYLLTGRYALDPASSVYARIASGYRPGGPNAVPRDVVTQEPLAPTTFDPDTLVSYEIGYKADLLERTVSLTSALYDIEWNDLQQHRTVNGINVITNAGKARVQGAELSATFRPTERWSLSANLAYGDARFTEDAPGLGTHDGDRLPNSARWSGSLQGNARFSLFDQPAYAGVTWRYVGERDAGVPGSSSLPSYKTPSYSLTDLQAGVDIDRFSLAFFARNVFDKRAQLSASTSFIPLSGNASVSVAQPRTFGLTLSTSF